ncbi:MAG: AAA family ATPase [Verrucomicrobiaceae bacterium]|nr:AAA family ATPase [Verrucomicrobiaceae bacterium]
MSRLSAIREALAQSPQNISLLLLFARECIDDLRVDEAREVLESVLVIDPGQIDAQLGIARVLYLQGDLSGAAVRAERVLQRDPNYAPAHLLLSRVSLGEGDKARAIEHFDRAAQADGTLSDPALERELGRTARDARRPATPAASESSPSFEFSSDPDSPDYDVDSLGEEDFDWRPETFYAPGDPERARVTFQDVGGMDQLKEEIRLKIIYPLQHPDLYKAYGRKTGGGIMIYGPPGCGKTLILRAVAGEVPCNYLAVGLHEIFDPYWGSSERNLHQVFETARANAPCVLVFDEIDSLALDRRNVREAQLRNLVNQFLHELDGLRGDNQRVLVIGSTNQPSQIDPAFRRPGRFDQAIFVPPPDDKARAQIIELLARDKPISHLDTAALVRRTREFSGADLKWVFDRAAELTLSAAIQSGKSRPITMDLLVQVAGSHSPSAASWFEGLKSLPQFAAEDSLFNDVRKFLNAPRSK